MWTYLIIKINVQFTTPTIVFMPHCAIQLYESVLRSNWAPDRIDKILLIGNRIREYSEKFVLFYTRLIIVLNIGCSYLSSSPLKKLQMEQPCIARFCQLLQFNIIFFKLDLFFIEICSLAQYINEMALPEYHKNPSAFNSIAVQYVLLASLPPREESEEGSEFWHLPPTAQPLSRTS